MRTLFLFLILLTPMLEQGRSGRLRPPEALNCDRNKLTSFTGIVTRWSRDNSVARLSLSTDADTQESFELRFEPETAPEKLFLLAGEVFRPDDWNKVELSPGRLRTGIQATVWVCEGSANPIIDWRVPPR